MTIRAKFCFCILIFTLQMCCAQSPSATGSFLGRWVVKDVWCSECGKRLPSEKGAVIQFTPTEVRNPLAENCTRDPGYGLLSEMSGTEVIASYGRQWPQSVSRAVPKEEKVRYGVITCGGINLMQMLFLSDRRAFYFFEGGVVFDLQRTDPNSL